MALRGAARPVALAVLFPLLAWPLPSAADQERFADGPSLLARADLRYQEQNGTVRLAADPAGGPATVLRAEAGPRTDRRVGKAALILPFAAMRPGATIIVEAEFYFPLETPLNSIHLMDLECKFCGQSHNPGLRLYLRHGRLRIDRKKINGGPAWTNDRGPSLVPGRWHRIRWELTLGADDASGRSEVFLDGTAVLRNRGRTLPDVPKRHAAIDRLQIGLTANSNDRAAVLYLRGLTVSRGE